MYVPSYRIPSSSHPCNVSHTFIFTGFDQHVLVDGEASETRSAAAISAAIGPIDVAAEAGTAQNNGLNKSHSFTK